MLKTERRSSAKAVRRMAVILAACLTSSCTLFNRPEPAVPVAPPPLPAPPPVVAAPPPPPRPVRKPAPPAIPEMLAPEQAPAPGQVPELPPESVDPAHLQGLDENGVRGWLGEPTANLEAPPARIWRYATPDCVVDVYFFMDLQNKLMRALHYEVRSHDTSNRRDERCFEQLVTGRQERQGTIPATYRGR